MIRSIFLLLTFLVAVAVSYYQPNPYIYNPYYKPAYDFYPMNNFQQLDYYWPQFEYIGNSYYMQPYQRKFLPRNNNGPIRSLVGGVLNTLQGNSISGFANDGLRKSMVENFGPVMYNAEPYNGQLIPKSNGFTYVFE